MAKFANGTTVSEERSQSEILAMLRRFGADEFGYQYGLERAQVMFRYRRIPVRFSVSMPKQDADEFCVTGHNRPRSETEARRRWQQEVNRRWRSLAAVIKANLIAVDDGVLTFEQAFLPYMVWPGGRTTAEGLLPVIQRAMESGGMPALPAPDSSGGD